MSQPEPVAQSIVEEQLVKSRHRVRAHGEVFTPRHMVDRMLELVREELEAGPDFVDKTFLEPAAGHGNFLVAILRRKLRAVETNFPPEEWLETLLFALASVYGIELLEDNHRDAKASMLAEFLLFHKEHGVACGLATQPAEGRGFPHRHERYSRRHLGRPGLARRRDRILVVEPNHRGTRDGAARAVHARLTAARPRPRRHRLRQLPGLQDR